jgi:hypothetical protein
MKKWLLIVLGLTVSKGVAQVASEMPPQGPRASALAGTFVGVANDGWTIFHNPAGLSRLDALQGFGSYQLLPVTSLTSTTGGFVTPLDWVIADRRFGTVGISYEWLGSRIDASQSLTGESERLSTELALGISHGFHVLKDVRSSLAFGYSLKLYYLDYGRSAGESGDGSDGVDLGHAYTLGVDVGVLASLRNRVWLGAYILNVNRPSVGTTGQQRELPQKLSAAVSYMPYDAVLTAIGVEKSLSRETRLKAAVEIEVYEQRDLQLFARFGLWSAPNVFTAGAGLRLWQVRADYSILIHNVLSPTHQFGLLYDFGSRK